MPKTRRTVIYGWEHGDHYANQPSDGNIRVEAGSARTGNYGLRVDAQPGVASYVQLGTNPIDSFRGYHRAYVKFDAFPEIGRIFLCNFNHINGNDRFGLCILPTGEIAVLRGTFGGPPATIATLPTVLQPGHWYRLEWAFANNTGYVKVLLDGNVEMDWTGGWVNPVVSSMFFGALDTEAAALSFHVDDVAVDYEDWPGHGRVKAIWPSDIVRDSATWTPVGTADKVAAIDASGGWDDTTYLECTTGTDLLMFGFAGMPSDAVQIYGWQYWIRAQRISVTSAGILPAFGWRGRGLGEAAITQGVGQINTAAAITVHGPNTPTHQNYFGRAFLPEFWDDLTAGFSRSLGSSRVFGFFVEVDYTDQAGAQLPDDCVLLADFEGTTIGEFRNTILGTAGNAPVLVTGDAVFGDACLELTHPAGSRSYLRTNILLSAARNQVVYASLWAKIVTPPTSGSHVEIAHWVSNTTFMAAIDVRDDGAVRLRPHPSAGAAGAWSSPGLCPIGEWVHFAWEYLAPTAGSFTRADGRMRLWVDNRKPPITLDMVAGPAGGFGSVELFALGSFGNVTGGAVVRYDGVVVDRAVRHTIHLKIATLFPAGASVDHNNAAFTVVGAPTKWEALDDDAPDDDSSYVLSQNNGNADYYLATPLSPNAVRMLNHITVVGRAKRDPPSGSATSSWISRLTHPTGDVVRGGNEGTVNPAADYAEFCSRNQSFWPIGQLRPQDLTDMELGFSGNLNAIRCTALRAVVAFTAYKDRAPNRGGSGMVIG